MTDQEIQRAVCNLQMRFSKAPFGWARSLRFLGSNPYNVLYHSIVIIMEWSKDRGCPPTRTAGEQILRGAHFWFVDALDGPRGHEQFQALWGLLYETWWGTRNVLRDLVEATDAYETLD